MTADTFGAALEQGFKAGRRLCVGIDPHPHLLRAEGFPESAAGAERFGRHLIDAAEGTALAIKLQIAFFERYGSAGYAALERLLSEARAAQILTIADAKRGDIGSSFDAYARAWLSPDSPLEADALTVSAFQGFGVLEGALQLTREHGKGLFVLVATSNPEACAIQTARTRGGETVSAHIMQSVESFNRDNNPDSGVGSVGAVLGATLSLADYGLPLTEPTEQSSGPLPPILAPGFGHQGGELGAVRSNFGRYVPGLLVAESRSLVDGGLSDAAQRIAARATYLGDQDWRPVRAA